MAGSSSTNKSRKRPAPKDDSDSSDSDQPTSTLFKGIRFHIVPPFAGYSGQKVQRLIEEAGGKCTGDISHNDLTHIILSPSVWAKEETQTKSLLVKNVKAANAENATEENPDYHRVWLLSLDWALESIKKDKKLKERDYDYERQADNVRAKRAAEALADRKRNGGKSRYGPGGRRAHMRQVQERKDIKLVEKEIEQEKKEQEELVKQLALSTNSPQARRDLAAAAADGRRGLPFNAQPARPAPRPAPAEFYGAAARPAAPHAPSLAPLAATTTPASSDTVIDLTASSPGTTTFFKLISKEKKKESKGPSGAALLDQALRGIGASSSSSSDKTKVDGISKLKKFKVDSEKFQSKGEKPLSAGKTSLGVGGGGGGGGSSNKSSSDKPSSKGKEKAVRPPVISISDSEEDVPLIQSIKKKSSS